MKNLLSDWFEKKNGDGKYIIYDLTIEDQINEWVKKAKYAIDQGIPMKNVLRQAELQFQEGALGIRTKHDPSILLLKLDIEETEAKLSDIKNRFDEYVEAEKANIPDRVFEGIDKLEARTNKLQAQADEHEQIKSELKL